MSVVPGDAVEERCAVGEVKFGRKSFTGEVSAVGKSCIGVRIT